MDCRARDDPGCDQQRPRRNEPGKQQPQGPEPGTTRAPGGRLPVERDRKSTTSELQSQSNLVCRLLLEKKKKTILHTLKPLRIRNHQKAVLASPYATIMYALYHLCGREHHWALQLCCSEQLVVRRVC